jgi:hypothetical protein
VCRADNLATVMCRLSWNLGVSTSWNPQGLSRLVMGLLYLYLFINCKWVDTRWQWSIHILHKHGLWRLITQELVWGSTWEACSSNWEGKNGNHPNICSRTQKNQEKPVSRWKTCVEMEKLCRDGKPVSRYCEGSCAFMLYVTNYPIIGH